MFKVTHRPVFTRTIKVQVPIDDDRFREETFKAKFEGLPMDDLDSFEVDTTDGMKALLTRVVQDLEDVCGDDDKEIPFSDQLLADVLSNAAARGALYSTYLASISGLRTGN